MQKYKLQTKAGSMSQNTPKQQNFPDDKQPQEVKLLRREVTRLEAQIRQRTMNYLTQLASLRTRKDPLIMYKYTDKTSKSSNQQPVLSGQQMASVPPVRKLISMVSQTQEKEQMAGMKVMRSNSIDDSKNQVAREEKIKNDSDLEKEEMKKQMSVLMSKMVQEKKKAEKVLEELKECQQQLAQSVKNENEKAEENRRLAILVQELRETISKMGQDASKKEKELGKMKEELVRIGRQKEVLLQEQRKIMEQDIIRSKEREQVSNQEVLKLSGKIKELEELHQISQVQKQKAQQGNRELFRQLEQAKKAKKEETHTPGPEAQVQGKKEFEQTIIKLKMKVDSLNKTIVQMKQESSGNQLLKQNEPLLVPELRNQIRDLINKVSELNEEKAKDKQKHILEVYELTLKLEELQTENKNLHVEVRKSQMREVEIDEANTLKAKLEETKKKVVALKQEKEALTKKLSQSHPVPTVFDVQISSLRALLAEKTELAQSLTSSLSDKQQTVAKLQATISKLQAQNEQLVSNYSQLQQLSQKRLASSKEQTIQQAKHIERRHQEDIANFKQLISSLQAKLEHNAEDYQARATEMTKQYDSRCQILKEQYDLSLSTATQSHQVKIAEMQLEIECLKKTNQEFAEKQKNDESIISTLRNKFEALMNQQQQQQQEKLEYSLTPIQSNKSEGSLPSPNRNGLVTPVKVQKSSAELPEPFPSVQSVVIETTPSRLKKELEQVTNYLSSNIHSKESLDEESLAEVTTKLKRCLQAVDKLTDENKWNGETSYSKKVPSGVRLSEQIRMDFNIVNSQNRILGEIEEIENFKKDKINELETYKTQYEAKLVACNQMVSDYKRMLQEKEIIIKSIGCKNKELQQEVESLLKKIDDSAKEAKPSQDLVAEQHYQNEIGLLRSEINRLKSVNDFIIKRSARYQQTMLDSEIGKKALLKEFEAMKSRLASQQQEAKLVRDQLRKIHQQYQNLKKRRSAQFEAMADNFIGQIIKKQADHKVKIQKLDKQLSESNAKCRESQKATEAAETQMKEFKLLYENLKKTSALIRKNTHQSGHEDESTGSPGLQHSSEEPGKKDLEILQHELSKYKQVAKDKENDVSKLQREVSKLKAENLSLHVNLKNTSENYEKDKTRFARSTMELLKSLEVKERRLVYVTEELSYQAKKTEKQFEQFIESYTKNAFKTASHGGERRRSVALKDKYSKMEQELRLRNAFVKTIGKQLFEIYQLLPQTQSQTLFQPESDQELLGIVADVMQFCRSYLEREEKLSQKRQRKDEIYIKIIQGMLADVDYKEEHFEDAISACCQNEMQMKEMETLRTKAVYTIKKLRTQKKNESLENNNNIAQGDIKVQPFLTGINNVNALSGQANLQGESMVLAEDYSRDKAEEAAVNRSGQFSQEFYDIQEATLENSVLLEKTHRIQQLRKKVGEFESQLKERTRKIQELQNELSNMADLLKKCEEKCQKEHAKKSPVILQKGRAGE